MTLWIRVLTIASFAVFVLAVAAYILDFPFAVIAWTGLILICAWAWIDSRKGQHAYRSRVV